MEQLNQENDPAMTLHLTSVLLFQANTQALVHCPGKCVPNIISFLKDNMESDKHTILVNLQGKTTGLECPVNYYP